ncbi:HD-GYP domain-containing protein [Rhizobium sp. LjRoot98]|uniref:HD-GYP domain-containing protein n=1 Tax=Rhizobium sp. LjRoot98 TaxID=3342345 RepID=UPI003ED07037
MLKRIKRHQVRVGMFVTDIEDPLRDEAAPVRSFLLKDEAAAAKVRASNIISLVIDIRRGVDVGSGPAQPEARQGEASLSSLSRAFTQAEIKEALQTIEQTRPLLDTLFANVRLSGAATFEPADRAVEQIAKSMESNPAALIGITRLKTKDEYTFLHSLAVSALMVHFARFLKFDEQAVRILGVSGLLHDIGKMVMPDALLSKKGALTDEEMAQIRTHPVRGYELLSRQADMPQIVLDVCLHHHERIDGKGYPFGLSDEQLSPSARIAAICDVYDAMTSARPYKRAWTPAETLRMMLKSEGHFDRHLLAQFNASLRASFSPVPPKDRRNGARAIQ